MLDFEVSEQKEEKDWEEVLPLGELELVSLNTMIPRKLSNALGQATGWLQLTSPNLRYTKQATVQILLERGLKSFFEDIEKADNEETEELPSEVLASDSKVIDIIKSRKRSIDPSEYESFANKHTDGYRYKR
jgi:hypothetical protein